MRTHPDVNVTTCAEKVEIPDSRICPGEKVVFTCRTYHNRTLVWRISNETLSNSLSLDTHNVSLNTSTPFGANFTVNLTADEEGKLVSNLTVIASDAIQNVRVTCFAYYYYDDYHYYQASEDVILIVEGESVTS